MRTFDELVHDHNEILRHGMPLAYLKMTGEYLRTWVRCPSWRFLSALSWWRHQMETFSAVTGPLCGEFTSQRPVAWSFDVSFDLRLNKRLNKQSRRRWFESHRLHRFHYDVTVMVANPLGWAGLKAWFRAHRIITVYIRAIHGVSFMRSSKKYDRDISSAL